MKPFAVAVLLVGLLVAGIAASGAAGKSAARNVTWHLVEKQVGFNFIDNPPRQGNDAPPLIGDQFALSSELLTKSGKHAGWLNATCTVTTGGTRGVAACYGVFSLKGGRLMAIAQVNFASPTTDVVIAGGTGVYRGVSGTVESVSRGETNFSDDTFDLVLP